MNYALYDATGTIKSCGICPDGHEHLQLVNPGEMLYIGKAEMHDRIDVATGKLIKGEPPAPSYRDLRRREYPTIATQLDLLWHAMDQGDMPVAPEFYNAIKRVKDAHPKPDAIPSVEL